MREIDCLFIHPSTHYRPSEPGKVDLITFVTMPLGTIALADLLDRNGYSTKIFHTGIEQIYDRGFRVEDLFHRYAPSVVGIDLHWYVHSYDAIRIAKLAKQHSSAFVIMGGFTSTYYAEEILSRFDCVDAVISGDASVPLLELMNKVPDGDLDEVPNLVFRAGDSIRRSEKSFIAKKDDLGELNYCNFELLSNHDKYHRVITQTGDLNPYGYKIHTKKMAWVPLGRGCSVNCSYCGGGFDAQQRLSGRRGPVFHPVKQVVEILARFEEEGIDSTYLDFDPCIDRVYYRDLFQKIRSEGIDISAQFALWSPSTDVFIRDFARTFNPLYSTMIISPESGSEEVRRRNKGFYYSDEELFRWLNYAKNELIPVEIYFSTGLSWETPETHEETLEMAKSILERYPVVSMSCNPIQMEPGGIRYIEPEKYGIKPKWEGFMDYYNLFRRRAEGLPVESQIGYDTIWQTEEQIIENSLRFDKVVGSDQPERWKRFKEGNELLKFNS